MARNKTVAGGDTQVTFTNRDAAKRLGKSVATVKRYKKILTDAYGRALSSVINDDGSFCREGIDELAIVATFFSSGRQSDYQEDLYTRRPELAHEPVDEGAQVVAAYDLDSTSDSVEVVNDGPGVMNLVHGIGPSSLDLQEIRGDVVATRGVETVLAMADEVLLVATEALEDDLMGIRSEAQKLEAAADALRGKRSQLQKSKLLHKGRAERLQVRTLLATEEIQELMDEVQGGSK